MERKQGGVAIGVALDTMMDQLTGEASSCVSTGYHNLDELMGGLFGGEVTILAARPGMGKTALATCLMQNVAKAGEEALMFSAEMPREQVTLRMACGMANINILKARKREITSDQYQRLREANAELARLAIWIDDTGALPINELAARARRSASYASKKGKRLALVVVDYLQLLRPSRPHGSREQEVAEISGGLKAMSKELGCHVLALSQLNRAVEMRGDRRPQLSDLRDSGSIEQDADNVVFIYREGYYDQNSESKLSEIIVSKQRQGPQGYTYLEFDDQSASFRNTELP